ncbi:hypothetical protein MKZ25_19780 [Solibacillus sp. FSL W7-1464]|uniref:hypothetical protein n=1 Tax=Solibacillus sp. FSL W7-1464 TaxID=2921706 RepID=UPI0030F75613
MKGLIFILSFLENEMIAILAVLGIIVPALFALFSVNNYTAFDRKLVPRNKSSIIYIKQLIGTFLYIIPLIIVSAYYFAFLGYKYIGFTAIYSFIYLIFAIYLMSKVISLWKWCTKHIVILPPYPKLFSLNEKYKIHLTILFTYAILTTLAIGHLKTKTVAILTTEFLIQALIFSVVDFIICLVILLPLFSRSNSVDYKLIYDHELIDSASLKTITEDQPLILEYYLNETTSVYKTENLKYRIIRYSNGNEPVHYTVYELLEKQET